MRREHAAKLIGSRSDRAEQGGNSTALRIGQGHGSRQRHSARQSESVFGKAYSQFLNRLLAGSVRSVCLLVGLAVANLTRAGA